MTFAKRRVFSAEQTLGLKIPNQPAANVTLDKLSAQDAQLHHKEILSAIDRLRGDLAKDGAVAPSNPAPENTPQEFSKEFIEAAKIKSELQNLSLAIETTKREIAAVRFHSSGQERITDVTHELDAIVGDTETATNAILENCENIENLSGVITLHTTSAEERELVDEILARVMNIYEACNFQDISGQRITKIVNTLKYIEARIEAMMDIWGGDEAFVNVPLPEPEQKNHDEMLLNGPARSDSIEAGETASQADIDAMFD